MGRLPAVNGIVRGKKTKKSGPVRHAVTGVPLPLASVISPITVSANSISGPLTCRYT
jgi:hypothetical protein